MNYLLAFAIAVYAACYTASLYTTTPAVPEYHEVGDPTPPESKVADLPPEHAQEVPTEPRPLVIPNTTWHRGMAKFGPKKAQRWVATIEQSLKKNGSDRPVILVASMSLVESSGNRYAKNEETDAVGLMGLRPYACKDLKRPNCDRFDPTQAFEIADLYLSQIETDGFDTLEKQLFAYRKGPTGARASLEAGQDPAKHEYVKKVLFVQEVLMRALLLS